MAEDLPISGCLSTALIRSLKRIKNDYIKKLQTSNEFIRWFSPISNICYSTAQTEKNSWNKFVKIFWWIRWSLSISSNQVWAILIWISCKKKLNWIKSYLQKLISRSAHTNSQYESPIFTTNFLFTYLLFEYFYQVTSNIGIFWCILILIEKFYLVKILKK